MSDISRIEGIFLGALEKSNPEECAAFLNEMCMEDADIRRQVERLLLAHPRAGQFLESPDHDPTRTTDVRPDVERAGTMIGGRYKLLEPIGEGGMGNVWMAQQTEPVKRAVALKLIKRGLDTKAVLARFEAERQALALMDHPNIAKVFDAGATDLGRPYFVMELVKGVPITRYCDERKLTLRSRLDLFIPVCQAVQHAHLKGVIHRDLKPSNVLVARYDDRAVPKVIDFGVAKAAGQPLTDRTLVTGFGALVGTPEYMSPEQAQLNQLDIDTRSDVYALGVLLYELLAGSTPVTRGELEAGGLLEVLRLIREQEPPRPSTRLTKSATLPEIAVARGSEPRQLPGLLRNDLDWIVMKALQKDRNRRYETAAGFAADIERYLAGEVVQAHPPSAGYRLWKTFGKHRVAIATASTLLGTLIAAVGISTALALTAKRAEVRARASANAARESLHLAAGINEKLTEALSDAEQKRANAESRNDPRTGLLRMAQTLQKVPATLKVHLAPPDSPALVAQREFATMYVLLAGQKYANLLPEFNHDGASIRTSSFPARGDRWVTVGADKTALLRDAFTGRQIAILRRGNEEVIDAIFSPDGATVLTKCQDGVIRFWGTTDGAYRAEIEARQGLMNFVGAHSPSDPSLYAYGGLPPYEWNRLSNDRLLTNAIRWDATNKQQLSDEFAGNAWMGPVELWDTGTGRLVSRLDLAGGMQDVVGFLDNGRWVVAGGENHPPRIFSSQDGRSFGDLDTAGHPLYPDRVKFSPCGKLAAAFVDGKLLLWDTTNWHLRANSNSDLLASYKQPPEIVFTDEETIALNGTHFLNARDGRRLFSTNPIYIMLVSGDIAVDNTAQLFDLRTGLKITPPRGRIYHSDLAHFAPDGRFLFTAGLERHEPNWFCIDVVTDNAMLQSVSIGARVECFHPEHGWVGAKRTDRGMTLMRLPSSDHLAMPPDPLELWAQLAARGQLDERGAFVKWDESTWEKKRLELAAKPVPYADFPFPGQIAEDRMYWLRREYEEAPDAERPALIQQLLDRAEASRDKLEANHWRALLPPKSGTEAARPPK